MRVPPLAVILSWPPPNYTSPHTRGSSLEAINAIFTALMVVAVVGRFYSRIFVRRTLGLDDWMIIPAFFFAICTTVIIIIANVRFGWESLSIFEGSAFRLLTLLKDRHIWDIPRSMYVGANVLAMVAKVTFTLASTFVRLSLLCFYYRIVKDSGARWFKWILHASVAFTISVCICFICLAIWICIPVRCYWQVPPQSYCRCLDEGKTLVGGGVASSFLDLLVTVLPIPIIMRLQMPLQQRICVCILLCMGFVVTIAGSLRTYYSWKCLLSSFDETWWAYFLWIAASVEIDLAVICSCAPAWKSLLQNMVRAISSKLSTVRTTSGSPNSTSLVKRCSFNPLPNVAGFRPTPFDFEEIEQGVNSVALRYLNHQSGEDEIQQIASAGHHGDFGVDEGSVQRATPGLRITMRRSFDQTSAHIELDARAMTCKSGLHGWQSDTSSEE